MGKFDDYINVTAPLHAATVKGKLGNANEVFLEGDTQNIENEIKEINSRHEELNKKHDTLSSKHESLSRTVQGIAATGGASTATNTTYNNDSSGLNAENAQDAIDELQGSKVDKISILQELGEAEDKVMSQKVVSTKLNYLEEKEIGILTLMNGDCQEYSLKNKTLLNNTGEMSDSDSKNVVIISVFPGMKVNLSSIPSEQIHFYNENNEYLSSIAHTDTFTVIAEAHFVKFAVAKTLEIRLLISYKERIDYLYKSISSKLNKTSTTEETKIADISDKFIFCDSTGNIIACLSDKGFQCINFIDKNGNEIKSSNLDDINQSIKDDGFYFVDRIGNIVASIDKKGIHAVNIHEDGYDTQKSGWLNGKTIFSLCDSLGAGGAWQTLLAKMSGAKFDQELNGSQETMNNGTSLSMGGAATLNTLFYGYAGYPKGLSSQQQRAMNFVKLDETVYGAKDLLLIENINDINYFRDIDKAEDIKSIPSIFVKHTPIFKDRIFATAVTARDYFTKNYVDVLTGIEPNVGTSLNFQIQTKGYDLTINSGATTAGTFTVNIGSESYPITVNNGMSAEQIAQNIYIFRFNGFKTSIDGATVKFTAELDEYIDATITCETNTGITYSLDRTNSGLSYYQWVFKSHNVNDWLDISNWDYFAELGFISAVKGLFEYLAAETPKTKIVYVIAPRFMHKWNKFLRADGTVNMEAYNNDAEVINYNEFVKAQIKVCELYNIEYVNLAKELGWNQANMKRVYGESTIHWNNNGSIDIANYLFRKLN